MVLKHLNKILLTLIIAAFSLLAYYTWVKSPVLTHGFASYYTSAKIITDGGDMTRVYDSAYFYTKMRSYGFGNVTDPANIPGGGFMLVPFTPFLPVTAKILWNIFSVILLCISVLMLLKAFNIKPSGTLGNVLILITLLFYPVYYNISYGQAYLFLLLLSSLAVYGFQRKNTILLSISIAVMIFVKGYGIYPLAALLLLKRYKEFSFAALFTVILFAVTLPFFGITAYTEYYSKFYSLVAFSPFSSNAAYQTLNSFFGHLLSYNSQTNTNAIAEISQYIIYYILQPAGFCLLVYIIFRFNKIKITGSKQDIENNIPLIIFALSFGLNVLFAPGAEDHHSVLYLPPIFASASFYLKDLRSYKTGYFVFAVIILLLALPLPFRQLGTYGFPVYLLAYPRVYGAVILSLFTLWLISAKRRQIADVA